MTLRPAPVPPDELTAAVLDAAFVEVERVAAERGAGADGFTAELMARAVDRLWGDEDREALRAKAHAAASACVDALFDEVGDAAREAA